MALTLEQALRNGLEIERAGARFYTRLAERAADMRTRDFLSDMVQQEQAHAQHIENLASRLTAGALADRADQHVELVETAPSWELAESIDLRQALEIALEAENHAALYYDAIADFCEGEVGKLLTQLARTEEEHAVALRRLLDELDRA